MSNYRDDVARKFSTYLIKFDSEDAKYLLNSLYMVLDEYEIEQRTTEVGFADNSNFDLLQQFLASKAIEGCSQKTIEQYCREMKAFDLEIGLNYNDVTSSNIRNYLAKKKIKGCKDTTIRNSRSYLSSVFGWLYNNRLIQNNPIDSISPIKCAKVERYSYSDVEMMNIKECCNNIRDKALVEFMFCTGCRISEIVALNQDDIDYYNKSFTVKCGKGKKDRIVFFTDVCLMRLKEYLSSRNDNCEALFVTNRKPYKRIGTSSVRKSLRKLGQENNINNVHPHRFRRTFATSLIDKGMGIEQVSMLLGHTSIATTQNYYDNSRADVQANYNKYMRI